MGFVCYALYLFLLLLYHSETNRIQTKLNDKRIKILEAANIYDESMSVEDQFKNLEIRFLDFDTGETYREYKDFDIDKYDQLQSLRFSDKSKPVPADKDIAIIKNREKYWKNLFFN